MADDNEAPKPPPPAAIPDLKKAAAEKKPDGVAWTPGVARASASVTIGVPPKAAPTVLERLKTPYGMAAVLALLLLGGGGLFSLTALHVAESRGGSGGGLSGVGGSVKFRAARGADGVGFVKREAGDDARQDRMKVGAGGIDLPKIPEVKIPGAPGEAEDGGGPMAYDTSGNSRAGGTSGNIPGGGAGAGGGDEASAGGRTAPQLQGNVSFRGMRSVSSTAGFRGLKGGRAMLKNISGRGGSSKSSGGASSAEAADSNSVGGSLAGSSGSRGAGGAAKKDAGAAGTANAGGGGGGGGGDAGNFDDLQKPEDVSAKIGGLMQGADDDYKKAEKDKKIAMAMKATGNDLQAAYYYDKYKKEQDAGDKKKAEANRLSAAMTAQTQEMAEKAIKDAAAAGGGATGGGTTGGGTTNGGTVISAPR